MDLHAEIEAALTADTTTPETAFKLSETLAGVILKHGEDAVKLYFRNLLDSAEGKQAEVRKAVVDGFTAIETKADTVEDAVEATVTGSPEATAPAPEATPPTA